MSFLKAFLLALIVTTAFAASGLCGEVSTISFTGLEANNEGAAAWNTDGSGPEIARWGHDIDWVPEYCLAYAFYYLASRDFVDSSSTAGMHCTNIVAGFPAFIVALANHGYTIDQLTFSFGALNLGDDIQGQDWFYDGALQLETRYYTGGTFIFQLDGQDLVGGDMPVFTILLDYNDIDSCIDDQIYGLTEFASPVDMSSSSTAGVQEIAAAFLADVGSSGFQLVFDSMQPAGQNEFANNGRFGAYFEAHEGAFETSGLSSVRVPLTGSQSAFVLHPAYPNPFNPVTTISFDLKDRFAVDLRIFDVSGCLVRTLISGEFLEQGQHVASWYAHDSSGREMPSGTYFYRLDAGGFTTTKMIVLIK